MNSRRHLLSGYGACRARTFSGNRRPSHAARWVHEYEAIAKKKSPHQFRSNYERYFLVASNNMDPERYEKSKEEERGLTSSFNGESDPLYS